ncbi:MAG: hypothetical protein CMJ58_15325 [Planctomycetaceae bacterium]|nr:hypothetical protein [Planctomycetaceae bacterium]
MPPPLEPASSRDAAGEAAGVSGKTVEFSDQQKKIAPASEMPVRSRGKTQRDARSDQPVSGAQATAA